MAKGKKDKTGLIILLIGGAGALWWYFSRQATTAPATTTPLLPPSTTQPLTALPVTQTTSVIPTIVPPVTQTAPQTATPAVLTSTVAAGTTTASGVAYDPRMDTLQAWAQSSLNACDLARWNNSKGSFTSDEWAGLFDIYFNDWQSGQGNTAARTAFWNAWRTKYSILTATPC